MEVYSDSLAKLFAAENIDVQIEKTSTAYFNPKTRKMAFPTWILNLPVASRELLMLHEASHALHTPEFGTHEAAKEYEMVFRNILNILEDKRIEDAMKAKFPGAKSTFIRGFYELINANLFGLHFDDDVQEMSLLDRMNLYFKGDYYFDCKFTEEEQVWVNRAANNKTFEEVYQNAIELYEHIKEEYAEKILEELEKNPNGRFTFDDFEIVDGPGDFPLSEILDALPEEKREELEKALEGNDLEGAKNIIKDAVNEGQIDNFTEQEQSVSDNSWERSQERMKEDDTTTASILNLNLSRHIHWRDFVIPNDTVTETIRECMSMSSSKVMDSYANFMSKYRKEIDPTIKHMVREFMRKQAAEEYRRTKTSKTGNLDLQKLPHYKYDSNLFLNKSVTNGAKNHGFVLLLDWSGSMGGIMTNAILQLINNVMFCKSIQVPFVAYAFTSHTTHAADAVSKSVVHGVDAGSLRLGMNLKLVELVDSTKSNYDEQVKHLFYLAYSFMSHYTLSIGEAKRTIRNVERAKTDQELRKTNLWDESRLNNMLVVSDLFELSSTPLNDSLILMNYILPDLKRSMNIDVMNLITITDGDSDGVQFPAEYSDRVTEKCQAPTSFNTTGSHSGKVRRIGISDEDYAKLQEKHSELHRKWSNNTDNTKRITDRSQIYIRSLQSNKVFSLNSLIDSDEFNRGYSTNRQMTRKWAALLKAETNVNVMSIELVMHKTNSLRRYLGSMYGTIGFDESEKLIEQYRKNGFLMLEGLGYDKIFVVNIHEISNPEYARQTRMAAYFSDYDDDGYEEKEDDHLEKLKENSKGTFTTRALTSALGKNVSRKNKRKFLATCVVDQIAEHQQIKKKNSGRHNGTRNNGGNLF